MPPNTPLLLTTQSHARRPKTARATTRTSLTPKHSMTCLLLFLLVLVWSELLPSFLLREYPSMKCPTCCGDCFLECPACQGECERWEDGELGVCSECSGDGEVECFDCEGSGELEEEE